MASFDEARQCPKCKMPGEIGATKSIARSRDQLIQLTCKNKRCRWYNTSWTVQRRPDGSVPDPDTRERGKDFPPMNNGMIRANMQDLERLLKRQREGGAEV